MEGSYKFIAECRKQAIREFLENYWENPESQPEECSGWLMEKGIIRLLKEIGRE